MNSQVGNHKSGSPGWGSEQQKGKTQIKQPFLDSNLFLNIISRIKRFKIIPGVEEQAYGRVKGDKTTESIEIRHFSLVYFDNRLELLFLILISSHFPLQLESKSIFVPLVVLCVFVGLVGSFCTFPFFHFSNTLSPPMVLLRNSITTIEKSKWGFWTNRHDHQCCRLLLFCGDKTKVPQENFPGVYGLVHWRSSTKYLVKDGKRFKGSNVRISKESIWIATTWISQAHKRSCF